MKVPILKYVADYVKPGTYPARYEGRRGPQAAEHGPMYFWEFRVVEDGVVKTVVGVTSASFTDHPKCKAYNWAKAIDPGLIPESDYWDDEAASGMECQVVGEDREVADEVCSSVKDVLSCQVTQLELTSEKS